MRAFELRRALLLASTVLVPFACVNTSSSPPGPQGFDGGQDFDARVDFDAALPDGALPDLSVPPPPPPPPDDGGDAGSTAANVTVLGTDGLPKAGVAVVFQDATGAVLEAKTTDALGRASRSVLTGSMVTVAVGAAGRRELVTFLGIKPGDEILALDVVPAQSGFPALSVTVPIPAPEGTFSFRAQAGDCIGSGASPITVTLLAPCFAKGQAPAVVIGYNDGEQPSAWSFKKDNPLAVDGGAALVTGLGAWATQFGTYTLSVTNAPADATTIAFVNAEVASGVSLHQEKFVSPAGGAATFQLPTMPGYADAFQPQVGIPGGASGADTETFLAKSIAPAASGASQAFDGAQIWPSFTSFAIDATDAAHPKISWALAPLTGADGGFARIAWVPTNDGGGGVNGWTFVAPPGTTGVQAPQLPAALAAWVPESVADPQLAIIGFVDEDDIPSYEALLSRYAPLLAIDVNSTFAHAPVLATGTSLKATLIRPSL